MTKLSLDDLSEKYDPEFVIQEPSVVYNRNISRSHQTFIVVSAQNATPVEPRFWATLMKMAELREAELLVDPIRYKNPTSQWSGSQRNAEHWDRAVRPYLWNQRLDLNSNLSFLGDIRVQPTNSNPLSGVEGVADASSSIVGHTRVQTKSVATPSSKLAKMLWTTGACTVPNYTDSRVGRLGRSHHSLSALIVELKQNLFFIRRLHWDDVRQSVIDLNLEYTPEGVCDAPVPLALVMGDTHAGFVDPLVHQATFGPGGMVEALQPQHLVWHDVMDAYSINPHHYGKPFIALAKAMSRMDDAAAETQLAIDYIHRGTPKDCIPVVVASNHDDMLSRWVNSVDWRTDPVNAEFYLETALAMARSTKMGAGGTEHVSAFAHWLQKAKIPNLKILSGGESFFLGDHELGLHGDKGPNGQRGSIKNLRRLGNKVIIGHSHSPGEDEGALQTGTSSLLQLEYNRSSPSSWQNAHAILHANNKTQLVVIIQGQYRT